MADPRNHFSHIRAELEARFVDCVLECLVAGWSRDELAGLMLKTLIAAEAVDEELEKPTAVIVPFPAGRPPTPAEAAKILPMGGTNECVTCGGDVRGCMC